MSKDVPLFLFLDLETTGHDPLKIKRINGENVLIPWHEIVDIGAIITESETLTVISEFNEKIKPRHPERCLPDLVNDFPRRFKAGEWNNAVGLGMGLASFFKFCGQFNKIVTPGGQNFFFDWTFLTVAMAICDISEEKWQKYFDYHLFDTFSMAIAKLWKSGPFDPKNFSLRQGDIQRRLGIEPEPLPHKALNGAHQAHRLFRRLRTL